MNLLIKYRTPDNDHITLELDSKNYILTLTDYIEIIKPCSRIGGDIKNYMDCRKNNITNYLDNLNKPKNNSLFQW